MGKVSSVFSKFKLNPFYLTMTHQKQFAALSLWVHMKTVFCSKLDLGRLSKSNELALVEDEICEVKTYDEEKFLDLTEKVGFDAWSKATHRSLHHELDEEEVPLSYM